jgi:hypothetical protein
MNDDIPDITASDPDEPITLEKDQAALIATPDGKWGLYLPDYTDEQDVPEGIVALVALYTRWYTDPILQAETIAWFTKHNDDLLTRANSSAPTPDEDSSDAPLA